MSTVLTELVKKKLFIDAIKVANEVEDNFARASVLRSAAESMLEAGMLEQARLAIQESLAAGRLLTEAKYRASALVWIAEGMARVGMSEEAEKAISEAISVVLTISDSRPRASGLRSIAVALAAVDKTASSLKLARMIPKVKYSLSAFELIADELLRRGKTKDASEAMREMFDVIDACNNAKSLTAPSVLKSITVMLAKAGMVSEAFSVTGKIDNAMNRANVYKSVAKTFMAVEKVPEAQKAMKESFNATCLIGASPERTNQLQEIALDLARFGMTEDAVVAARDIENVSEKAITLMKMAAFWLEHGQVNDVRSILDELKRTIGKADRIERSKVRCNLAVILARIHSYKEARRYADQCPRSSDRLAAYTAILREYHIERNPSLARLFAEEAAEMEEED